jgi:predicted TIM-barrel fold metal-dependent hydrolase
LAFAENVYFEISMAEGVGVVARWIGALGLKRIVFGSHYPFFYLESALLKMKESGLDESQKTAIFADNAKGLLA